MDIRYNYAFHLAQLSLKLSFFIALHVSFLDHHPSIPSSMDFYLSRHYHPPPIYLLSYLSVLYLKYFLTQPFKILTILILTLLGHLRLEEKPLPMGCLVQLSQALLRVGGARNCGSADSSSFSVHFFASLSQFIFDSGSKQLLTTGYSD